LRCYAADDALPIRHTPLPLICAPHTRRHCLFAIATPDAAPLPPLILLSLSPLFDTPPCRRAAADAYHELYAAVALHAAAMAFAVIRRCHAAAVIFLPMP